MCTLAIVLLIFPGSPLDSLWALNPDARVAFQSLGKAATWLMFVVGAGCAFAAIGLWRRSLLNAVLRHDYRALIGLPVGGAMIFYLARYKTADSSSSR